MKWGSVTWANTEATAASIAFRSLCPAERALESCWRSGIEEAWGVATKPEGKSYKVGSLKSDDWDLLVPVQAILIDIARAIAEEPPMEMQCSP